MVTLHLAHLTLTHAQPSYAALECIPAMQRRRLSPLAKLALNTAISSLDGRSADYIVWVSKYGDEAKTLNILQDVLNDQTPSPTQFSTSVHNAISGLYSILCQDDTPSTRNRGRFIPTLNLDEIDPLCGELDYIVQQPRNLDADIIMSNNFAFGGINTSLIFKRVKQ